MSKLIDVEEAKARFRGWKHERSICEEIDAVKSVDVVPVSTLEQIKWERDSFAEQIREIGGEPFAKWDAMDVVKVVRCKDCMHKHPYNNVWLCRFGLMMPGDDGYCSYGKKVSE